MVSPLKVNGPPSAVAPSALVAKMNQHDMRCLPIAVPPEFVAVNMDMNGLSLDDEYAVTERFL